MERFASLFETLAERGWGVSSDLFSAAEVAALREEAVALFAAGAFRPAAIGQGGSQAKRAEIRSDRILWFDPEAFTPAQAAYSARLEELREAANRSLFLSLVDFEAHYAVYPPGAFYRRHVDRFRTDDARVLSTVLYLNPNWTPEQGGQLRLYAPDTDELQAEVEPRAGTFVLFRADSVPHEVLASAADRYSVTGWLRRRKLF